LDRLALVASNTQAVLHTQSLHFDLNDGRPTRTEAPGLGGVMRPVADGVAG